MCNAACLHNLNACVCSGPRSRTPHLMPVRMHACNAGRGIAAPEGARWGSPHEILLGPVSQTVKCTSCRIEFFHLVLKTTCDFCCVLLESVPPCIHGLPHVNALCFCSMLLSGDFFRDQSSQIKAVVKEQRRISRY